MVRHGVEVACEDDAGCVFFSDVGLCSCPGFYLSELVESDGFAVWSPCEVGVNECVGMVVWGSEIYDNSWVLEIVCFLELHCLSVVNWEFAEDGKLRGTHVMILVATGFSELL